MGGSDLHCALLGSGADAAGVTAFRYCVQRCERRGNYGADTFVDDVAGGISFRRRRMVPDVAVAYMEWTGRGFSHVCSCWTCSADRDAGGYRRPAVSPTVAAIVLAAGASRRLGQPKQSVSYGGETLLERAIRLARDAGAAPLVVVLGAGEKLIRASVAMGDAICVINENWEQGIASSIHAGLGTFDAGTAGAAGALIMSCDQPRLTADHLRALLREFAVGGADSIVASAYACVVGIPAVFPRCAFPNLFALRGDKGARALLVDPPCALVSIAFDGGEVDIDRPEDLTQLE